MKPILLISTCKNCGVDFEYLWSGTGRKRWICDVCKPILKKETRDTQNHLYKKRHREEWNQRMRDYRKAHPEISKKRIERRKENPELAEKYRASYKKWFDSPKGRQYVRNMRFARRSFLKEGHKWFLSADDWSETLNVFGCACVYCGSKKEITQDHFFPLSRGGKTELGNIVPCCRSCNSRKNNKLPENFLSPEQYIHIVKVLETLSQSKTQII